MDKEVYAHSTYLLTKEIKRNVLEIIVVKIVKIKYCMHTVQTYPLSKIRIQKCTGKST